MADGGTQKPKSRKLTAGHPASAAPLIGALSFLLAFALEKLGLLRGINAFLHRSLAASAGDLPHSLPPQWLWSGTAAMAFFLPAAMLFSQAQWRRVLLWIISLVLVAAWLPVLALAAFTPEIAAPWIATFWAGFCAFYYAGHHHMPADASPGARK